MTDTLDRFTRRARQALTLAQEEAQRLNHNYIGTEHLLIGLLRVENSVSSRILQKLGLSVRQVQELVEQTVGFGQRSEGTGDKINLTRRTKLVLESAVNEARKLGHHYIDTAHLLLGLDPVRMHVQGLLNRRPRRDSFGARYPGPPDLHTDRLSLQ